MKTSPILDPGRPAVNAGEMIALAREVLETEAKAVHDLAGRIDARFVEAVNIILGCRGRVVVSGMGKSGHVGRKIAATLASTGTPAFFVHPAEAAHGDLGMVTADDVLIGISYSGESAELLLIVPILKRQGARLIAITGSPASTLCRHADVHLDATVPGEADPLGLAPSASTTAALALGDALAFALLRARGFSAEEFARTHPGGTLGKRLLMRVEDIMHAGERLPRVPAGVLLARALVEMSGKGLGLTAVVDDAGRLTGILTDGDLRRALERQVDVRSTAIDAVMTVNPHTIGPEQLAIEALRYMEHHRITGLLVVDAEGRLAGALNIHDLFRAGLI